MRKDIYQPRRDVILQKTSIRVGRKNLGSYRLVDAKALETAEASVLLVNPRTKGSTGYPDAILGTEYFRDPRYLGSGWKATAVGLRKRAAQKLTQPKCNPEV